MADAFKKNGIAARRGCHGHQSDDWCRDLRADWQIATVQDHSSRSRSSWARSMKPLL